VTERFAQSQPGPAASAATPPSHGFATSDAAAACTSNDAVPLRLIVLDQRLLAPFAALSVLLGVLWLVRGVLVPLLFVAVLTFLGAPLVARIERRGWPRSVGAGLFLLGGALLLVGLGALVVPTLLRDLTIVVERAPEVLRGAVAALERTLGVSFPRTLSDLTGSASRELLQRLSPVAEKGGALVGEGALGLARGAASAAGMLAQGLLVPVITFFVLAELPGVKRVIVDVSPPRLRSWGSRYAPLVEESLSALVRGQVTVAALMAVLYAIGLLLSGVPAALAIAVLSGAAYLIPFASASVAFVLSAAFALLERGSGAGGPILGALVTCIVVQVVEGYVLTPRIVGEKAGLSPLATLLAVLLGGTAAGFLGVLFALPVGAVLAVILREEVQRHRQPDAPSAIAADRAGTGATAVAPPVSPSSPHAAESLP
jgi:predicted PurR-regulated permease PerM